MFSLRASTSGTRSGSTASDDALDEYRVLRHNGVEQYRREIEKEGGFMNVQGSVDAIMESGESFGSIFYKTFFARCPAAAKYFEGNDMSRQSVVLTMTLKLIEQHQSHGFKAIEQYLKHIGTRHKDLSIPQDMYPDWKDALLATLEQFHGDDWNNALATDWSKAVDDTVEIMFRGYEERGSV